MKLNILVLELEAMHQETILNFKIKQFIKIIGTDISLNAIYVSNADKCYLIKERDKLNP